MKYSKVAMHSFLPVIENCDDPTFSSSCKEADAEVNVVVRLSTYGCNK